MPDIVDDQFNTEPLPGIDVPAGITPAKLYAIANNPDYYGSASPSTVTVAAIVTKLSTESGTTCGCAKCRLAADSGVGHMGSGQVFAISDKARKDDGSNPVIICDLCSGWGLTIPDYYFVPERGEYAWDETVESDGESVTTTYYSGVRAIGGKDDRVLYPA